VNFGELDDACSDTAPLVWTRIGVRALLRCGIPNFGSSHRTDWPLEVVPAVWAWLDFLNDTRRLDPRSDPLWELRKPLICYGGLGFDGRWRPEDDPSPIPCECYLPYRASAEYLNGEIVAGRLVEDALVRDPPNQAFDDDDPARVGRRWTNDRILDGPPRSSSRRVGARRPGRAGRRAAAPRARRPGAGPGAGGPGAGGARRPRPRGDAGRSGSPSG
jgi:hypothetical protein